MIEDEKKQDELKRFLVQKETGRIYVWTPELSERGDMVMFEKKEKEEKSSYPTKWLLDDICYAQEHLDKKVRGEGGWGDKYEPRNHKATSPGMKRILNYNNRKLLLLR